MLDLSRHLDAVAGLCPMPAIMARAVARARDPASTVDEVAAVLVLDPSIVQTVVRMSNSPFYGFDTRSVSLGEAIQRVGFHELLRLVGAGIAHELYRRELGRYRIPPEVFWESGLAAALLMQEFASDAGVPGDDAYLAGLLREVGMLAIDHALLAERRPGCWDCTVPVRDWERQVAGCDHAHAGRLLLTRWDFPPEIGEAIGTQWDDGADGPELAVALRLTNRVLERTACDFSLPFRPAPGDEKQAGRLGLRVDGIEAAVAAARARFQRLRGELLGA